MSTDVLVKAVKKKLRIKADYELWQLLRGMGIAISETAVNKMRSGNSSIRLDILGALQSLHGGPSKEFGRLLERSARPKKTYRADSAR